MIVTTPQEAAQKVARRAAETAMRYDIEILGVVENMYGDVFGEGGGQLLADDLDVPLLGKIPLTEELRRASDSGRPLVLEDPDNPAAQALFHAARGIIAARTHKAPFRIALALPAAVAPSFMPGLYPRNALPDRPPQANLKAGSDDELI